MNKITVKVINKSNNKLPEYGTLFSAGMDIRSNENIVLRAGTRLLVKSGLFIQLPDGYEAQIRPRSGLALKHGITVLNSPGTIDVDYTGEVGIILINTSLVDFEIKIGDRIAQMVINPIVQGQWLEVAKLDETERNSGGFGHTGVQ